MTRKNKMKACSGMLMAVLTMQTACVDEVTVPYEGATVSLEATPVKGKGLQLEAKVGNPQLKVSSCGFRMTNDAGQSQYPGRPYVEEPAKCDVACDGSTTFTALLSPTEEWLTQFTGYAYAVINGHEYRSETITAELGNEDFERHIPQVEEIRCLNIYSSYGRVKGTMRIVGEGFYGWGGRDGYPSYIQLVTDGGDFQFEYGQYDMKITPTSIQLPFTANAFDTFSLKALRQGGVDYDVNLPIELSYPDHLVAPSYSARVGEPLYLHQKMRDDGYYQEVDSLKSADAICRSFYDPQFTFAKLFAFISEKEEITCQQFINGSPLAEPFVLKMSYPWEKTGQASQIPALPKDRVMTADAVWYLLDGVLNRLDPQTSEVETFELPFTPKTDETVRLGKDDQNGLLLCRNCNSMAGEDYLYRFNLSTEGFEQIGSWKPGDYFDSSCGELLFVGQEGNNVYLAHRLSDYTVCYSIYDAVSKRIKTRDYAYLQHPDIAEVKALYKGKYYLINGQENFCFLYCASKNNSFEGIEHKRMPLLPSNFDKDWYYMPDYIAQSGHYLYLGHAPMARIDLDNTSYPMEYLGCPRGTYYTLDLLNLDGESCEVIDRETGNTYTFKEDR